MNRIRDIVARYASMRSTKYFPRKYYTRRVSFKIGPLKMKLSLRSTISSNYKRNCIFLLYSSKKNKFEQTFLSAPPTRS